MLKFPAAEDENESAAVGGDYPSKDCGNDRILSLLAVIFTATPH
jgi:hypothetical protein